jgi:hypothetical protein
LRQFVARRLEFGGNTIGDIEAIAHKSGRTILISCKSIIYTSEYDAGRYNQVRNQAARIEEALRDWDKFLETLRSHPRGGNYDLRSAGELFGVVVTPHVVYLGPPSSERFALPGCPTSGFDTWL